MKTVTAIAPEPKPGVLERTRLRAFRKTVQNARSGRPLRASFWWGVYSGLRGLRSN